MNKKIILAVIVTMVLTASFTAATMDYLLRDSDEITTETPLEQEAVEDLEETVDETTTPDTDLEADDEGLIKVKEDDYNYLLGIYDKYKQLEALEEYIRENYYLDVSDIDFMSYVSKGLFEALEDPYSQYYTPEEYKSYTEVASGSYEGIGVVVAPGEDGFITVVSPISDSPGFKAGLKTNDKILKVDGVEYSADELDQAVMNIRGPAETTVILTIRREDEILDISVVRRQINLEAAKSEVLDNNIGLLTLVSFDEDAAAEFEYHLEALLQEGVEGLILDLRNNGGGYLDQCLEITDRIIGEGVIVKTKDNQGNVTTYDSGRDALNLPLIVLVNGGSASASEILTGAVKDNQEGIIVGTTTFGKGLVQTMLPLPQFDYAGFKLTIKQYFTPNDFYINEIGIEPDVIIEDDEATESDEQLEKAIELLMEAIK